MRLCPSPIHCYGALAILAVTGLACRTEVSRTTRGPSSAAAESKAVQFLAREVPAWHHENRCFSCHNNGDGARALYAAAREGYPSARGALRGTSRWLQRPSQWEHNHGEPGFSDQRLARLQFAFALLAGLESGELPSGTKVALADAARSVAADQNPEGGWFVEPQNPIGSPVTYGNALATYAAWRILEAAQLSELQSAARTALSWLQQLQPNNTPGASVALMTAGRRPSGRGEAMVVASLAYLRRAQTPGGGWGPYPEAPAEPFDTALVLLALAELKLVPENIELLRGGERYLERTQQTDGSWPPSTRPPGGESYAQRISTTSWALLALLRVNDVLNLDGVPD